MGKFAEINTKSRLLTLFERCRQCIDYPPNYSSSLARMVVVS